LTDWIFLASVFSLALAGATWILGYRRGKKDSEAGFKDWREVIERHNHEAVLAASVDGKERGVREGIQEAYNSKPKTRRITS
jgi:predicted metallo-beta-lactamase superfamily hydrolase